MKKYLFLSISLCALTLYAADNQQTGLDVDQEEVTIDEQAWNYAKKQVISAYNIEQNDQRLNEIPEECDATPFAKWLKKQFDIQNDSEEDISAEVTRWAQQFLIRQQILATQISSGEEDRDGSVAHSAQGGLIVSGQPGTGNVSDDEAKQDDDAPDGGWMPQMPSLAGVSTAPRRLIGAMVSAPANVIEGARQRWPFSAPAE